MSGTYLMTPVELTDAELDAVTGGLVTVVAFDVVDVNNNDVDVAIPVNAAAAVAVLGESTAVATQLGRVRQ